jgi:predicted 3-demethylubiquinone-9 3-methyltransferase (glyoxalase superfamily)
MGKIMPFLWYDNQAEEAMRFYTSIFKHSRILSTMPGPNGTVMGGTFEVEGQVLTAFNGGPEYHFTPAISLFVNCETQPEVDELWEKLSEGGHKDRCGWLQDKYGLSWQIVPTVLGELMSDPDPVKANRVRDAMLQMSKLDISGLRRAYEGK